jgi:tetratricopeptide (TPR) repeat protein
MAKSLAQKHMERTLAANAAGDAGTEHRKDANLYTLMMAQLHAHTLALKNIQSIERKEDFKCGILEEYEPYLEGVIDSDSGLKDEVLTTCLVWRIDANDIDGALKLAEYVIKHDLQSTDRFDRSIEAIIADEITDKYLKSSTTITLDQLNKVATLLDGRDYPDQVRAKLEKSLGYIHRDAKNYDVALIHLEEALRLHEKSGVKKDITALKKQIKKEQV